MTGSSARAIIIWGLAIWSWAGTPALHAQRQTVVRRIEIPAASEEPIVLVRFHSCELLDRGARGVAVVDADDEPVTFQILKHNEEGETVLAVDGRGASLPLALHYGDDPQTERRKVGHVPISLVMRTFSLQPGHQITQLPQVRSLIDTPRADGVMLIPNVYQGHNPFGPDQGYVADVSGLVDIDSNEQVQLFSVSSHQSALSIDDRSVLRTVEANVTGDSEEIAKTAIPVALAGGRHTIRYRFLNADDRPVAILGRIDEDGAARMLDGNWFVHHQEASLGRARTDGPSPAMGFDVKSVDHISHDGILYSRIALQPIAPPPDGMAYRWRFGDGTRSRPADATTTGHDNNVATEHVYVSAASGWSTWRVTLELVDQEGDVEQSAAATIRPTVLQIHGIHDNDRLTRCAQILANVDYTEAGPQLLETLYKFAQNLEFPSLMAPLTSAYVSRYSNRSGDLALDMKYTLAEHLAGSDPDRALALFDEVAQSDRQSWRAACAAAQVLDLMIFDLERTKKLDPRIGTLAIGRPPRARALLQVRLGDMYRVAGDVEQAAEAYRKVHDRQQTPDDAQKAGVLDRAYHETAIAYLQQERYPALRDVLFQWEADFPMAKLGGDLPLLIGRYFQAVGTHQRAAMEYQTLLKLNPLHHARPEIAFRLGESLTELGRDDEAQIWFAMLIKEYPNSPFAEQAYYLMDSSDRW